MYDPDTDMGGSRESFPTTRHSVIEAARSADGEVRRQAFDRLIAGYWKPVYKYVRIKWKASSEDAKDLTQGFFAYLLEKDIVEKFDPGKAGFRTYLRMCLDGYTANERKAAGRLKRGGQFSHLSLEFEDAEGELRETQLADDLDLEEFFHREWIRSLFTNAMGRLRQDLEAEDKTIQFRVFERYDVEAPAADEKLTYEMLAKELGLPVTQVTNYLAGARRRFRAIVLERLRELSGSEREYRAEAKELLGVDPG